MNNGFIPNIFQHSVGTVFYGSSLSASTGKNAINFTSLTLTFFGEIRLYGL